MRPDFTKTNVGRPTAGGHFCPRSTNPPGRNSTSAVSIWATREVISLEGGRGSGERNEKGKIQQLPSRDRRARGTLFSGCVCTTVSTGLLHGWLLFPPLVSRPARPGRHGQELRPLLRTGDVGPAGGSRMSRGHPFCANGFPVPRMLGQFVSEHCALPRSPELPRLCCLIWGRWLHLPRSPPLRRGTFSR